MIDQEGQATTGAARTWRGDLYRVTYSNRAREVIEELAGSVMALKAAGRHDACEVLAAEALRRLDAGAADYGCPDPDIALRTARRFVRMATWRLLPEDIGGACALALAMIDEDCREAWGEAV